VNSYFSNLHSLLDQLEATAERRLLAAVAAFRKRVRYAQHVVAPHQRSLQKTRRACGLIEQRSADLYNNVHALIAAALAPPTLLLETTQISSSGGRCASD
jgi:hypothetical protein